LRCCGSREDGRGGVEFGSGKAEGGMWNVEFGSGKARAEDEKIGSWEVGKDVVSCGLRANGA